MAFCMNKCFPMKSRRVRSCAVLFVTVSRSLVAADVTRWHPAFVAAVFGSARPSLQLDSPGPIITPVFSHRPGGSGGHLLKSLAVLTLRSHQRSFKLYCLCDCKM